MNRKLHISDGIIGLYDYIDAIDDIESYECWQDEDTKRGYNHKFDKTFEEYQKSSADSRFKFTIIRHADNSRIGNIFLSSGDMPDLAIIMYKPYRYMGCGTAAFKLGIRYSFEVLNLDKIYAGCYPGNKISRKMIEGCGFLPHPTGNIDETHYITGEPIIQYDFILHKKQ